MGVGHQSCLACFRELQGCQSLPEPADMDAPLQPAGTGPAMAFEMLCGPAVRLAAQVAHMGAYSFRAPGVKPIKLAVDTPAALEGPRAGLRPYELCPDPLA